MLKFFQKKIKSSDAEEFVVMLYRAVLGRDPEQAILSVLPAKIITPGDKLHLLDALLASPEFRKKSTCSEEDRNVAAHFIDALLAGRSDVTFVQVGVNDAKNADFLRGRVIQNGWRGLMIEPHPAYIAEAKSNYGEFRKLIWENVAISNKKGVEQLFFVKDPPPDKPWSLGIASFDKEHVNRHGFSDSEISSIDVSCLQLKELLEKHGLHSVDLLVIDVEGHELEVIRSIDFNFFSVKLVVIETSHMDGAVFSEILKCFPGNYRGIFCSGSEDSVIYRLG